MAGRRVLDGRRVLFFSGSTRKVPSSLYVDDLPADCLGSQQLKSLF
jgi:hypothetical protein